MGTTTRKGGNHKKTRIMHSLSTKTHGGGEQRDKKNETDTDRGKENNCCRLGEKNRTRATEREQRGEAKEAGTTKFIYLASVVANRIHVQEL